MSAHQSAYHYRYLHIFSMLFLMIMLCDAVLTYKFVAMPFGYAEACVFVIPFWFIIGDIIAEIYGQKISRNVLLTSFIIEIIFIGGGNITRAMVSGLISDGYSPQLITVYDRHADKREFFSTHYHVVAVDKLTQHVCDTAVIVLSVKPHGAKEACTPLKLLFSPKKPLVLSVMTGTTIQMLNQWLGEEVSIVRAMPNTPTLIKAGATGLFAGTTVTEAQKQQAETLFSSIGVVAWLTLESQIDAIIALSGSGPAYFFLLIDTMQFVAIQMGLPKALSKQFALQTAFGAAKLALESTHTPTELRARVTSKGGTTAAAIAVFQNKGFSEMVEAAMQAAKERSQEIRIAHGITPESGASD